MHTVNGYSRALTSADLRGKFATGSTPALSKGFPMKRSTLFGLVAVLCLAVFAIIAVASPLVQPPTLADLAPVAFAFLITVSVLAGVFTVRRIHVRAFHRKWADAVAARKPDASTIALMRA
jgi:hypothetical protein